MTGVTALVLAGARGRGDPVADAAGVALKAFAPVAGVPMLDRVIAALQASPEIARIAIIIPQDADLAAAPLAAMAVADGAAERIAAAGSPSLSVAAGLDAMNRDGASAFPALIVTADHALLTPAMIAEFVAATPDRADLSFAVAAEAPYMARFPDSRRTWLRFADGGVSGCNLFLLRTPRAREAVLLWRKVEAERKKPWKLAGLLGLSAILAYLAGRLRLDSLPARVRARFGFEVAPVILSDPTAAIDVDKLADLSLAESVIATREAPAG